MNFLDNRHSILVIVKSNKDCHRIKISFDLFVIRDKI